MGRKPRVDQGTINKAIRSIGGVIGLNQTSMRERYATGREFALSRSKKAERYTADLGVVVDEDLAHLLWSQNLEPFIEDTQAALDARTCIPILDDHSDVFVGMLVAVGHEVDEDETALQDSRRLALEALAGKAGIDLSKLKAAPTPEQQEKAAAKAKAAQAVKV